MTDEKLTKDWFIKKLSLRTGYSQRAIREVWHAIEELLKDIIFFEEELVIPGLFKVYVTTIPEHKGHNAVRDEPMIVPESKRINIKASRALLKLFKEKEG